MSFHNFNFPNSGHTLEKIFNYNMSVLYILMGCILKNIHIVIEYILKSIQFCPRMNDFFCEIY